MTRLLILAGALALAACGQSGGPGSTAGGPPGGGNGDTQPVGADIEGCDPDMAVFAASPPEGESREGLSCQIVIDAPTDASIPISFQVIEPPQVVGGQTYPMILEGHGFGGSRQTSADGGSIPGLSASIGALHEAGYGILSIDQAGHGDTGGQIQVMNPDQEGLFLVAILDWLEANVDWVARGPDADAGETNMVLGAVGPSYGGGYQLILHAVDPEKRLDALVPTITWHDLRDSLFPGNVIKGTWDLALFGIGNQAGGGGNFDPFVNETLVQGLAANEVDQFAFDYFGYHGLAYFCNGQGVETNGGPGTAPAFAPVAPTQIDALFFQGFRDVLFPFNEAASNFECLRAAGGDVRLFTQQLGHNTIPVVPDVALSQPVNNSLIAACGSIDQEAATVAWFDEKLKGIAGAADAVLGGASICLSLSGTDAVFVDDLTTGGQTFEVPATTVVPGLDVPVPVPLLTVGEDGDVFGGIPRLTVELTDTLGASAADENNILFFGIGHQLASQPGVWELMDNQLTPVRGLGSVDVDMIGVAERLSAGDQIGLLIYGANNPQFATTGVRPTAPFAPLISVEGSVALPLIGETARDVPPAG